MDETQSLKEAYNIAQRHRAELENSTEYNSLGFQQRLNSIINEYERCSDLISDLSIFSPNEEIDHVGSNDIPFFLINFHTGNLILRLNDGERLQILGRALRKFDLFLALIDSYGLLSSKDQKLYKVYQDNPKAFSTSLGQDAASRRDNKIARFKDEKALKSKLEFLRLNPESLQNDEDVLRSLHLAEMELSNHQIFQTIEATCQEIELLENMPRDPSHDNADRVDHRENNNGQKAFSYTERLDPPASQLFAGGKAGPILSKDGKPLQPFTLLDSRDRLRKGVFRPGHSLPTMTIDEYLEEEKRRGGFIEGGGPESSMQPEPNEDDMEKADEETMKAREWDEFKEANPKGSGNTINRG